MEWKKFLVKFYNEKKNADPSYKFKDAMKAAKGPYRKQLSGGDEGDEDPVEPVAGGKKRKSRKQLSGGDEGDEAAPAMGGGKKSRRRRSSKRRTSKRR